MEEKDDSIHVLKSGLSLPLIRGVLTLVFSLSFVLFLLSVALFVYFVVYFVTFFPPDPCYWFDCVLLLSF